MSTNHQSNPRVWFITGISRGFGREVALAALAEGDYIVGTTRDGKSDLSSDRLSVLALDVSQAKDVAAVIANAWAIYGRINIVLNNAGFGVLGAVEEVEESEARRVFDTNFFGTFHVIHAVLPFLRQQGQGHILNVSSLGGIAGATGYGLYCASKFAVEGLSESLASEIGPFGIRVTIVEPGYFRTGFLSGNSLLRAGRVIEAYAETTGTTRATAAARDGRQPGDPALAARAIISVTRAAQPPLRLILGADALEGVRAKLAQVSEDLETWKSITIDTAFHESGRAV
jgi:NAD(P)-dependent dehydrogenase (short-subunit alcohol dehydrogenase family)